MTADCASDANYLHDQYLQPLVETDDKDVIIVTHSYGAIPGSAAAMGSSKRSRTEQGKTGGVIGIVFMSAFVKENGSISDTMGGQWPPFIEKDAVGLSSSAVPYTATLYPMISFSPHSLIHHINLRRFQEGPIDNVVFDPKFNF